MCAAVPPRVSASARDEESSGNRRAVPEHEAAAGVPRRRRRRLLGRAARGREQRWPVHEARAQHAARRSPPPLSRERGRRVGSLRPTVATHPWLISDFDSALVSTELGVSVSAAAVTVTVTSRVRIGGRSVLVPGTRRWVWTRECVEVMQVRNAGAW